MRRVLKNILLLVTLVLTPAVHAQTLEIWGSTTCQKTFLEPGKDELETATGIKTRVVGIGSARGIIALINGNADAAAVSADLNTVLEVTAQQINKHHLAISIPNNLVFNEIHVGEIVVIVNTSNPVTRLSQQQLARIYSGEITNWREVGGPDLTIKVFTNHISGASRQALQEQIMGDHAITHLATEVINSQEQLVLVNEHPGAIGYVGKNLLSDTHQVVKQVFGISITRPLAIVTLGPPSPEIQTLIDFYKHGDGYKYTQHAEEQAK